MLAALLQTRVFQFGGNAEDPDFTKQLVPSRGLQATLESRPVFILDTFKRYTRSRADVVDIRPMPHSSPTSGNMFTMGRITTCQLDELSDVRFEYVVTDARDRGVVIKKNGPTLGTVSRDGRRGSNCGG